jgi:hypothetical protein
MSACHRTDRRYQGRRCLPEEACRHIRPLGGDEGLGSFCAHAQFLAQIVGHEQVLSQSLPEPDWIHGLWVQLAFPRPRRWAYTYPRTPAKAPSRLMARRFARLSLKGVSYHCPRRIRPLRPESVLDGESAGRIPQPCGCVSLDLITAAPELTRFRRSAAATSRSSVPCGSIAETLAMLAVRKRSRAKLIASISSSPICAAASARPVTLKKPALSSRNCSNVAMRSSEVEWNWALLLYIKTNQSHESLRFCQLTLSTPKPNMCTLPLVSRCR